MRNPKSTVPGCKIPEQSEKNEKEHQNSILGSAHKRNKIIFKKTQHKTFDTTTRQPRVGKMNKAAFKKLLHTI